MPVMPHLSSTATLVIRSCQRIPAMDRRQRRWNCSRRRTCLLYRFQHYEIQQCAEYDGAVNVDFRAQGDTVLAS